MDLKICNLTKDFKISGKPDFTALNDVSLHIEKGKFFTFLGPSGCGKTTLLRIIAGFEEPTKGKIIYNGKNINHIPPNERGFSMVFQSYALFPHMTVLENISYGLKLKKLPSAEIDKKATSMIELLGLEANRTKYPSQMSGGQQQRVALARALVMEPEIILFDEPLSNLDAKLRLFMRSEIRKLQQKLGITAIYVTHDQEEAMAISDQVVVMNNGFIEQVGTPQEIYQKPKSEFVANFVGLSNIIPIEKDASGHFSLFDHELDISVPEFAKNAIIRPESLKVSNGTGIKNAKILESTFLGPKVFYKVQYGKRELFAETFRSHDPHVYQEGEEVNIEFQKDFVHFI